MDPHRLPTAVVPSRYDLTLRPDLDRGSFRGVVTIHVEVITATAEVWLNAAELSLDEARWRQDGSDETAEVRLDEANERCCLRFGTPRPVGPATLTLQFRGTLNEQLRGFYRSRQRDAAGAPHWLAATQFEATDARRAFPCWDEPAFKAVFAVTLEVEPGLTALSNAAVASEETVEGLCRVRFADTIRLPTYLVAFVVGRLEATPPARVGATAVRAWCVPGKAALARFGLDVAVASLRFFEEYYDLPYPGDKLDLIALPDFAAGAMENFGAVTFRETALLIDEAAATHQEVQRVADVVSHENAHLWFGDLVTMRWWNGLWLNEAFATFMEMLAVDAYRPAWRRWETFAGSRSAALAVDGLHASRPIEFAVAAPRDAEAMFDVLTYEKGASVLRMLERYLGAERFRAGVRLYLRRHAFGSTETGDLWDALGEAVGLPVGEMMHAWVFRPGYPLLRVRRQGDELVLEQERFLYLAAGEAAPWQVPVQLRLESPAGARDELLLLSGPEARLPLPPETERVVVNAGGHGFYRVGYDADLLAPLLDHLPRLPTTERYNLIEDLWAAVLAGLTPLDDYLDCTVRFRHEPERIVWSVLLGSFALLNRLIDDADRPALQQLVRLRLRTRAAELGRLARSGEDPLTAQLRGDLLRALGTLGDDPLVQEEAALLYAGGQADAAVQAAVIAVLAHAGGEARHAEFLERYRAAPTPQEEQRYLLALALFRPAALVDRTLALTLDGTVRNQDAPLLLRELLQGVHSREPAWAFVRARWDELARRFPGSGLRRLCEGVLGLTTPGGLEEVESFFRDRGIQLGGKTLEQLLEQLRVRIRLGRREGDALRGYLRRVQEAEDD